MMKATAERGADPKGVYRDWLAERARDATMIVEVGVLAGRTTARLAANTRGTVFAVDNWNGVPDDPMQAAIYADPLKSERRFRRLLRGHIESGRVVVVKADSVDAARILEREHGRAFDLIFIDADHRFRKVLADLRAWKPLVKPGGIAVEMDVPGWKHGAGSLWWKRISE
jgi:predicted O-methyltransferase YrrM